LGPVVYYVYHWGNISAPIVALVLLGLWLSRRHLVLAGLLLSLGIVVKPLAPVALALLVTCRAAKENGESWLTARWFAGSWLEVGRSQLVLAMVAAPVLAIAVLAPPHLGDFLALREGQFDTIAVASLHRLLRSFGLDVMPIVLSFVVMLVTLVAGRLRRWRWSGMYCLSVSAVLLALPVVWTHTLLMTLPLQVAALRRALLRWRRRAEVETPAWRSLESVLILGSVLALQLSQGLTGYGAAPLVAQGLILLWPVLAPVVVAAYVAQDPGALVPQDTGALVPGADARRGQAPRLPEETKLPV
jgi:hypothetical protein